MKSCREIQFTERDREIFKFMFENRMATTADIVHRFFNPNSRQNVIRRLKKYKKAGSVGMDSSPLSTPSLLPSPLSSSGKREGRGEGHLASLNPLILLGFFDNLKKAFSDLMPFFTFSANSPQFLLFCLLIPFSPSSSPLLSRQIFTNKTLNGPKKSASDSPHNLRLGA